MAGIGIRFKRATIAGIALAGLVGCDALSPDKKGGVSFSVATSENTSSAAPGSSNLVGVQGATANSVSIANGSMTVIVAPDTLIIDSIRVVLAQIVLRQAGDSLCGVAGHSDAGSTSCASISQGPILAKLPITAGAASLFDDVKIPNGTYTGIRVRIHNPRFVDSTSATSAFLAAHPEWAGKSMMIDGKFNGVAFHWAHDPPVQMAHVFNPPLVVDDNTPFNFTLRIDLATWFIASNGKLIPPNAPTNALYPQIAANIATSFHVFKDDTKKGHDDGR